MRILIVSNSFPLAPASGTIAAFCVRAMALALVRQGADVCVLAPDRYGDKQDDPGLQVTWFPWSGWKAGALIGLKLGRPQGLWHAFSLFREGRKAVREACMAFAPQICLAAWALPSGYFAAHVKGRQGVPYAVWCLGSDIHTWARKPLFRSLTRQVLKRASLVYADGWALAREVSDLAEVNCEFLPTSREPASIEPTPRRLDPQAVHYLFAGRWEKVKGLDLLLAAWRQVLATGDGRRMVLHIAGHGDGLDEAVRTAAAEPATAGSIDVLGWVGEADLAAWYRAVDCVVIPSRKESIPVVLSEAVQARKRLIVSDVGDMGELVRRFRLGQVVRPESVSELSAALRRFAEGRHEAEPAAFDEACRLFDIDAAAKRFLADARRLLAMRH